jgi:CubicO group peptidase (beta-lactamase class C family)
MTSSIETTTPVDLVDFGIDEGRVERIYTRIEEDIAKGMYPGAAVAMARRGLVVAEREFGIARLANNGNADRAATKETLWLLYSQTKPITSCAIWILADQGLLNLHHPVAYYIPDFAKLNKQDVTTFHLLTHQAGFPSADVSQTAWKDHKFINAAVSSFALESPPGEKVFYHSYGAHWVQAALIEAITGQDYRQYIAEQVLVPLGLKNIFVGVPESEHHRLAGSYVSTGVSPTLRAPSNPFETTAGGEHLIAHELDNRDFYMAGVPGAGGYATAGDMALFYQMLIGLGTLNGKRILSPRMVQYVTTNHTGDRIDEFFGIPMHRALGVHLRGNTPTIRGLASIAHPSTYGHGGVGTSYSFADPQSGVSFTYLTNSRLSEPGHSKRAEEIMTLAHASIIDL